MGKTFAEKLLAKNAGLDSVVPGQIVAVNPNHLLTHDNTSAIIGKISAQLEKYGVANPSLPVIVLDHVIPAANEKAAAGHKAVRAFVKAHKIEHFYDVGTGVCHQVVIEKGIARPGRLIVGSDSHTCSYGAVGCFSTGVDRTEAAALMLTGETWLRVPESIKINLTGKFPKGVFAKDLVLRIIADISASGAAYKAVEFHGPAIEYLSMSERISISNMGVEMDAKIAVFPVDEVAIEYMRKHGVAPGSYEAVWADPDAQYVKELNYDLSKLTPMVAAPHKVDNGKPVDELVGVHLDQCFLGTCTNGRYEDLRIAADILKGKKVHAETRLLVCPASHEEFVRTLEDDTMRILVEAGGVVLPTGCGPCLGAHQGCLAPGEKCLSTANRNFKGRMGCKDAEIYLASPATVAASAIVGVIADPRSI